MSKKLVILQQSLQKKEALFNAKLNTHFNDVKSANGQPLNDKTNGRNTFNRWDSQSNALSNLDKSIEKTKTAILREQEKIDNVNSVPLPVPIQTLIDSGILTQWRKHLTYFFVKGVEKGRIILNPDNTIGCKYHTNIPNQEQYAIFRDVYNSLRKKLINEKC